MAINGQQAIEGIELVLNYNHEDFIFNNFNLGDNLNDYSIMINDSNPGKISLIIYASSGVKSIDNIFGEISFNVLNENISNSIMDLDKILINGKNTNSGFLVFDNIEKEHVYSRGLSVSIKLHPEEFHLGTCYPNPFNPTTQIPFSIPFDSNVNIAVYDINGRFIANIIANNMNPGNHIARFDGKNLASGIYIIKMDAKSLINNERFSQSAKVLLLK